MGSELTTTIQQEDLPPFEVLAVKTICKTRPYLSMRQPYLNQSAQLDGKCLGGNPDIEIPWGQPCAFAREMFKGQIPVGETML